MNSARGPRRRSRGDAECSPLRSAMFVNSQRKNNNRDRAGRGGASFLNLFYTSLVQWPSLYYLGHFSAGASATGYFHYFDGKA